MNNRKWRISLISRYILVLAAFSILINVFLGIVLTRQAGNALQSIMRARMLDISNTAAGMLDGDILRVVSDKDKGTKDYETIMETLSYFQDNFGLSYIYCIKDKGNGEFVFGLDPSDDPGEFGSPIVYTDALYQASRGKSAVDDVPYEDEWGSFYSAYSPVFDSEGKVAGIVAVDFSRDWYDEKTDIMTKTAFIICILSLLVGIVIVILLVRSSRKRIYAINDQLNRMSVGIDTLMMEVKNMAGDDISDIAERDDMKEYDIDDLDSLTQKISIMMEDLDVQIDRVHERAYYDKITGVMNKECYLSTKNIMDEMAREGFAEFSILIYEMKELAEINRSYGHEYGDMALLDTASVLASVFGKDRVFRTGGNEFTVITETTSMSDLQNSFSRVDFQMAASNAQDRPYKKKLSLAMGYAIFDSEEDHEYMDVFRRADQMKNDSMV